jgi:D-3-phosphoglycerate dehydrogenase
MGNDIFGKTIGIVGIGHVGSRIAELCRGLFSMRVIACDPYLTGAEIAARGADKVELPELLRSADYVSINCPLNDETRGVIGAKEYALMQPHAYFITSARVWAKEPPPREHPLLQFDNVIASPHTAGVSREARATMGRIAAEQLLDALDGKRPPRIVNPEAWPLYARRFEKTFGFAPGAAKAGAAELAR